MDLMKIAEEAFAGEKKEFPAFAAGDQVKFGGEKRLSSLVYAEDQSNFKTRSLHHLRRPQAPSRIGKVPHPRHLLEWVLAAQA